MARIETSKTQRPSGMSSKNFSAILSLSQQVKQEHGPMRRLLLRGQTEGGIKSPINAVEDKDSVKPERFDTNTALTRSTTKLLPFLDSDEDSLGIQNNLHPRSGDNNEPQSDRALLKLSLSAHRQPLASVTAPDGYYSRYRTNKVEQFDNGVDISQTHRIARLKLHISQAVHNGVCNEEDNASRWATNSWWNRFLEVDTIGYFACSFKSRLQPLDKDHASVFYREMVKDFEGWWQEHWDSFVLSKGPVSRPSRKANSSRRRARQARATIQPGRSEREATCAQQLQFARKELALWYESIRVARLMAEVLLRSGSAATKSSQQSMERAEMERDDTNCESLEEPWAFEEGCYDAFVAISGIAWDNSRTHADRWVRNSAGSGLVKLYERYGYALAVPRGRTAEEVGCLPVATVPSSDRMLRLLHVLDEAWQHPASEPFRLPVLECEAPGYYTKIRDAVSLYSMYADVLRGATQSSIREAKQHAKRSPATGVDSRTSQENFISYAALRERLTVMHNNCALYNGLGAELTRCAEQVVSTARKAIRDNQAEEDVLLQNMDTSSRQRKEQAYQVSTVPKKSVWTLEKLAQLFPPNDIAKKSFFNDKQKGTRSVAESSEPSKSQRFRRGRSNIADAHTTPQLSGMEESASRGRVLPLRTGSHKGTQRASSIKRNADCDKEAKAQKEQHSKSPDLAPSKKKNSIFWVCCDRCDTWRQLPQRIDPPPVYWECAYMGIKCPETSGKRVARPQHNGKRPRGRPPGQKALPKQKKNTPMTKLPARPKKRHKSLESSQSSSSSSGRGGGGATNSSTSTSTSTDDTSEDESASLTSTSSITAERLGEVQSELERLEAEPVNDDPHGILERLRFLEKQLGS